MNSDGLTGDRIERSEAPALCHGAARSLVGDVEGNTSRIIEAANRARDEFGADLVMMPELAVSGYPPEDLLFHSGLRAQVARSIERLKSEVRGITLVAGYPEYVGDQIFNSAIVMRDGEVLANHRKACLPNYRVFDEKSYFTPGTLPTVLDLNGIRAGILVCEDIWEPEPAAQARDAGAEVLLVINASPYEVNKQMPARARRRATTSGGNGRSTVVRQSDRRPGRAGVRWQLLRHECARRGHDAGTCVQGGSLRRRSRGRREREVTPRPGSIAPLQGEEESVYGALVQGTRDYVNKHRFPGVVLGLSGGVRFGPDAMHCGGCARSGSGPLGGNAFALHVPDEQGRRRSAGFVAQGEAQRDFHRGDVRGDAASAQG